MPPLSCSEARESLLDFVEGGLDPGTRLGVEEHLRRCPPCGHMMESYKKTTSLCCKVLRKDPPDGLADRVLAVLREKTSEPERK